MLVHADTQLFMCTTGYSPIMICVGRHAKISLEPGLQVMAPGSLCGMLTRFPLIAALRLFYPSRAGRTSVRCQCLHVAIISCYNVKKLSHPEWETSVPLLVALLKIICKGGITHIHTLLECFSLNVFTYSFFFFFFQFGRLGSDLVHFSF